jgi:hypothetical protein
MATSVDFMHSVTASGERELSEGAESLLGPSFANKQGRRKFRNSDCTNGHARACLCLMDILLFDLPMHESFLRFDSRPSQFALISLAWMSDL